MLRRITDWKPDIIGIGIETQEMTIQPGIQNSFVLAVLLTENGPRKPDDQARSNSNQQRTFHSLITTTSHHSESTAITHSRVWE
jgi:hypothetical protein